VVLVGLAVVLVALVAGEGVLVRWPLSLGNQQCRRRRICLECIFVRIHWLSISLKEEKLDAKIEASI
jgi:hypothetical protein